MLHQEIRPFNMLAVNFQHMLGWGAVDWVAQLPHARLGCSGLGSPAAACSAGVQRTG